MRGQGMHEQNTITPSGVPLVIVFCSEVVDAGVAWPVGRAWVNTL